MDATAMLRELEEIGAVGSKRQQPAIETSLKRLQIEKAGPEVVWKDMRGPNMVRKLDAMIGHLGDLTGVVKEMRDLWLSSEEETPGSPVAVRETQEAAAPSPVVPAETPSDLLPQDSSIEKARRLALAKIRGDVPGSKIQEAVEENVPFMGSPASMAMAKPNTEAVTVVTRKINAKV